MATYPDIDWLLISLKRTPERLELFQLINAKIGLGYDVFEAVDGKTVDRTRLVEQGLAVENLDWTNGAVGAALSNLVCWERALTSGRPVGIMEDDIFLRHDFLERLPEVFRDLPDDWDIIHFGFNTDSGLDIEIHPGCHVRGSFSLWYPSLDDCERFVVSRTAVAPMRMHTAFGNCCYVVSPAGARKLIDGVFPMERRPVRIPALNGTLMAASKDALMNEQYPRMNAYICMPPIVVPINDKDASTIGNQ